MKKVSALFKKVFKLAVVLGIAYWVITTLFFGHQNIDEQTGRQSFYWSGLNTLWQKDRTFGFKLAGRAETAFSGIDGPYVIDSMVYQVTAQNNLTASILDSTHSVVVRVNNKDLDSFRVHLDTVLQPQPETSACPKS